MSFKIENYADLIRNAIAYFWNTRNKQLNDQINREVQDAGNRGAVTGGKQMDGFCCPSYKSCIGFRHSSRVHLYS